MNTKVNHSSQKTSAIDMTVGSIPKHLITFAIPLLMGNLFQMFYNTVDTLVVGNFVGKEALAAVGSTTSIINIAVFFFNGVSVGAGVVISQYFGAHDQKNLHRSVETTMALTLICSVIFTILGVLMVPQMLQFMSTPDDVLQAAGTYLHIYFAGISGLLVYNMGSGILRAVGDTRRPLIFLIFSSVLNVILDLVFVIGLHAGISGVAYATILSQFISAGLILLLLTKTQDIYHLSWKDLSIDSAILKRILSVGLPAGIQSTITAFSNVFVQGYINSFGSSCMAGWSCFNKLDQFVFLPVQSLASAATTFVSQNIGAEKEDRANKGTRSALKISFAITFVLASIIVLASRTAIGFFTSDVSVIDYGSLFVKLNTMLVTFNSINHVLAGALRGRGDAKGPMVIMLIAFVVIRQLYLLIGTHLSDSIYIVGVAYPVGWCSCCVIELIYFLVRYKSKKALKAA